MWLASLALLLAQGPAFDQIVNGANAKNRPQSIASMLEWIDAHPRDALAPRGMVWAAQLMVDERRDAQAEQLLERVLREHGQTEWAGHARRALGDLALRHFRFSRALELYDELARSPVPLWRYVGTNGAEQARAERVRFFVMLAVAAALLLAWVALARAADALWPAPQELLYVLPILGVIFASSFAQEPPEAFAIRVVALASVPMVWANAAAPRPQAWPARLALAGAALLQAAGVLYCAIIAGGLWGKVADTVAMGGH